MIALSSRAAGAAFLSALVPCALASGLRAQLPNEGCRAPSPLRYADEWFGEYADAGVGITDVTLYGTVERRIPLPQVEAGLMGTAELYHGWLVVDVTGTTWGAPGSISKGGVLGPTRVHG